MLLIVLLNKNIILPVKFIPQICKFNTKKTKKPFTPTGLIIKYNSVHKSMLHPSKNSGGGCRGGGGIQ